MELDIHLLSISILILVYAALIAISQGRKTPSADKFREKDRRMYPRYETSLRIKYKTPFEEGMSWIKDISESGARLFLNRTLKSLETGASLDIEIDLPQEPQPIALTGNIVWSKDDYAGFNFDNIQGDIKRLIQYVSEEQR